MTSPTSSTMAVNPCLTEPLELLSAFNFSRTWGNYKYLPDSPGFPTWIHNSCAINMSHALITAGAPKKMRDYGETTPYGGNSLLFRVVDVNAYLQGEKIGQKTKVVKKADIIGKQGILSFKIHFEDATGHLTLWNQNTPHPNDKYINQPGNLEKCFEKSEETFLYQMV